MSIAFQHNCVSIESSVNCSRIATFSNCEKCYNTSLDSCTLEAAAEAATRAMQDRDIAVERSTEKYTQEQIYIFSSSCLAIFKTYM